MASFICILKSLKSWKLSWCFVDKFWFAGRKNDFLIQSIKDYLSNKKNISLSSIDDYSLNGDYIESQAFGYLAIRSFLNLPISFPKTTSCEVPTVGGKLVENF